MSTQDMDTLARKIVSLEKRHDSLARAQQLPNSSVRIVDGEDVGLSDAVETVRDTSDETASLGDWLNDADSNIDNEAEHSVAVPDWIQDVGNAAGVAWDSTEFATNLALQLETDLAQLDQDLIEAAEQITQATEDAATALGAANAAQDRITDEVLPAIDDAAASPVTDARLTEGSLTVWPFQNNTVPAGALEPGAVGATDIADFAVTAKKFSTNRLHIVY